MNRIAIVGHPVSGYKEVEAMLLQCGMRGAQPSRRDGLLPHDITATLCKVHKLPSAGTVTAEGDIEQIQAGAVWHGLVLDLMLGNLDQELWGWADPQAIYALDYWKELDDKLTFVLVYDEPQRALMEAATQSHDLSMPALEHRLDNWAAYNGALLRFFLRNPERCLLVHAKQVRRNADAYLQQLQPLLDAPLSPLPVAESIAAGAEPAFDATQFLRSAPGANSLLPAQRLTDIIRLAGLEVGQVQEVLQATAAERHLLDQVLAEYPACLQLYTELQSAANLPLRETERALGRAAKAWTSLVQQRALTMNLASGLHKAYQGLVERQEQTKAEQSKENGLLLSQLHQVQEELEQHYLRKQELEQRSVEQEYEIKRQAELLSRKTAEAQAAQEAEKAARAKAASQKSSAEHNQQNKALHEENELLLSQLHQVQEELERYYLDNQRLKKQLPPAQPVHYGAAMRIKQQLSYRLGAVMIQRSRSLRGCLAMPWALMAEAMSFRQERAARPTKKLPPIHTYRDAHEAERVKQHLSYRLGSALLKHATSPLGWLKLPFALSREMRQFRLQCRGV